MELKKASLVFTFLFSLTSFFAQPDPPDGCVNVFLINPNIVCPTEYEPVCGCDGVTYINECVATNGFGITEWTAGECPLPTCFKVSNIDFGLCDMELGIALVDSSCQYVSGCGYIVDEIDYTGFFFFDMETCQNQCEETAPSCLDLTGLDFGLCTAVLGIAVVDSTCTYVSGCGYIIDNVDYSNYFFDTFEECESQCEPINTDCFDFSNIYFGDCEMLLGVGLVNNSCQYISGCGYVIEDIDYSGYFSLDMENCQTQCEETAPSCLDLAGLDFGFCTAVLGIALIDSVCVGVSGCGYLIDNVDYSNNFYDTFEECESQCEPINTDCFDFSNIYFGDCEMLLGVGMVNNTCQYISGCSYVVGDIDYTDYFYDTFENCQNQCEDDSPMCLDLAGLDFGLCTAALGIGVIDSVCAYISGCGYIIDNVDYSNYLYETFEECETQCEPINTDCFDFSNIYFGDCDMLLGIGMVNNSCQYISGCDYIVDEVDYTDYFYQDLVSCQSSCGTNNGCIDQSLIDLETICTTDAMPVCGCDGVTYNNACEATNWFGVTEFENGPCEIEPTCLDLAGIDFGDCELPLGYVLLNATCQYISGCGYVIDNVDYSNYFYEEIETCQTLCESDGCIDPTLVDPDALCTTEYAPVCGCNGITYSNACVAITGAGVLEYVDGECETTPICFDVNDIDFGPCYMDLGFAISDSTCQLLSGCSYIVDFVNYSNNFFESLEECQTQCDINNTIDDLGSSPVINIYPNPTNGILNIQLTNTFQKGEIILINTIGEHVYTVKTDNTLELKIDTRSFESGLYFLLYRQALGTISRTKVVINK